MGRKKKEEVEVSEVVVVEEKKVKQHVVEHLDRDPHDPRLVSTDRPLPSLND